MLNIHQSIKEKLNYFYEIRKIPNIIFHGPSGSGKRTIVYEFINKIYDHDKEKVKNFVMYVDCACGKGIKFIREDLKFFAKTNIYSNCGDIFKSIILLNADKLTMDAQSALRRCIELFSHNTRFFLIVEDKYNLLKPILSRFCEIYISEPIINGKPINLYDYNLEKTFQMKKIHVNRLDYLKKDLLKHYNKYYGFNNDKNNINHLMDYCCNLYEKGYTAIDILTLLEDYKFFENKITIEKKYELLLAFSKVRKEFRNEKLLILFILNFVFLDNQLSLENISFM